MQKKLDMYIGNKTTIIRDQFYFCQTSMLKNIYKSEFEWLLYKIIPEELFKHQKIQISHDFEECTSWLISEYMTNSFVMDILDTFICWTFHQKKEPKLTFKYKLVLSFEIILLKNGGLNLYHEYLEVD